MDFDLRIDRKDFKDIKFQDYLNIDCEHTFTEPSRSLLNAIQKRGLLDKCFTVIMESKYITIESLYHVVEFRNTKKDKVLVLEHICNINQLEEWKIKK